MRNKPRIRFKGFTEDWEQCKLGDLTQLITKGTTPKLKNIQNGINFIKVENISDDGVISINSYVSEEEHTNYLSRSILANNDILFSIAGTLGRTAIVKSHLLPANTNQALAIIRLNKSIDVEYINTFLKSNAIKIYIKKNPTVGAQPNLSLGQVSDLEINIPSYGEQNKISNLFSTINLIITLHQRKLEKLNLVKKALLQKLFPKNGSQFPEIRFKGFTAAWEQRKFSDIFAEVKSGLSRMLSNDDIGLPVVRANNINDGQLNLVDDIKYWYKNDPQGANTNNYLIEQGDILINFINSEAKMGTAAYVTRRPERDTIYTTNILRCKVNDEYNPYFIYSLTFLNSYKNYIASITKPAVNQASFTTVDFKKYSIKIPTVKEQNQIADLIETFNKLLTLHQRKLDKLQEVKKGLLQKMFV